MGPCPCSLSGSRAPGLFSQSPFSYCRISESMGKVLITGWQWDALSYLPSYHFLHDVSLMALRTFPGRAEEERRMQVAQGQRPFSIHLLPTVPAP